MGLGTPNRSHSGFLKTQVFVKTKKGKIQLGVTVIYVKCNTIHCFSSSYQ